MLSMIEIFMHRPINTLKGLTNTKHQHKSKGNANAGVWEPTRPHGTHLWRCMVSGWTVQPSERDITQHCGQPTNNQWSYTDIFLFGL